MSSNQELAIFDYLRGYLTAAYTQCGDDGVANCGTDKPYQRYYMQKYFPTSNFRLNNNDVAEDFSNAVVAFAVNVKKYDVSASAGPTLKRELHNLVEPIANELAEKYANALPPSGDVPTVQALLSNVITTTLDNSTGDKGKLVSMVIKDNTVFDKFVSKVTSMGGNLITVEDVSKFESVKASLSTLLRNTITVTSNIRVVADGNIISRNTLKDAVKALLVNHLTTSLDNFISSNYTSPTVFGSSSSDVKKIIEQLKTGNVSTTDLALFNLFCDILDENNKVVGPGSYASMDSSKSRINFKTQGGINIDDVTTRKTFKVINFLPILPKGIRISIGGSVVTVQNGYELRKIFQDAYDNGKYSGVNVSTVPTSLNFDAAKLMEDIVMSSSSLSAHIDESDTESIDAALKGIWVRVGEKSWKHKLADGTTVVFTAGTQEFADEMVKEATNCKAVGFGLNPANCRDFLQQVASKGGDPSALAKLAQEMNEDVTKDVVADLHPKYASAILKAYGFHRRICRDTVAGRQLTKIQNVNEWLKTYVSKKFTNPADVQKVRNNDKFRSFLGLLVQLVNGNPSVLNEFAGETEESTGSVAVPDDLAKRKIVSVESKASGKPHNDWNQIKDNMHKVYGNFSRGLTFDGMKTNSPFGMDNLFPSVVLPTATHIVRGSTWGGAMTGGADVKPLLMEHPSAFEYSRNISQIFTELLNGLRASGKTLSESEFSSLAQKLTNFQNLEKELFETASNIQLYSQLIRILDAEKKKETVTETHIKQYVNKYNHLLDRYEKTGSSFQTLISLLNDCTDDGGQGCKTDGPL